MRKILFCVIAFVCAACASAQALPPIPTNDTFEFHSGFWINLHHFLYWEAIAETPPPGRPAAWTSAVDYYRRTVVPRALLSPEASRINNLLSSLESAPSLKDSGLPTEFAAVLESVAPVYRNRWWPDHDRANREWMQAVVPLLAKYGPAVKKQLAIVTATD